MKLETIMNDEYIRILMENAVPHMKMDIVVL